MLTHVPAFALYLLQYLALEHMCLSLLEVFGAVVISPGEPHSTNSVLFLPVIIKFSRCFFFFSTLPPLTHFSPLPPPCLSAPLSVSLLLGNVLGSENSEAADNIWKPFSDVDSGTPLGIAFDKIEKVVKDHVRSCLAHRDGLDENTTRVLNTELSFLLSIAVFRNSLAGLLQVTEFLLRCDRLSFLACVEPFWTFLLACEGFPCSMDSSSLAVEILCAIDRNTKKNNRWTKKFFRQRQVELGTTEPKQLNRLFAISSADDANTLVHLIEVFGSITLTQSNEWSSSAILRSESPGGFEPKTVTT